VYACLKAASNQQSLLADPASAYTGCCCVFVQMRVFLQRCKRCAYSLLNTLDLILLQRSPWCCIRRCKGINMWHHAAQHNQEQDQQRRPHDCEMSVGTCKMPSRCQGCCVSHCQTIKSASCQRGAQSCFKILQFVQPVAIAAHRDANSNAIAHFHQL
jgi:hypothetical protein